MQLTTPIIVLMFEFSRTAFSMSAAGLVLVVIALMVAKHAIARAQGLEKIVGLSNLCFAAPLAVFGAEHLSAAQGISQIVPKFMPWHLFWAYFVGFALVAASLSIATRIQAFWAGLLFGTMMFLFVAMMDIPGTLSDLHNRISWALLCRETSFGAGGWMIAAAAMDAKRRQSQRAIIMLARVVIGMVAVFYGVEHFLHPMNVPGVPLEKFMPDWIPLRALISYATGAILIVGGIGIVLTRKARTAAAYVGTWIFLVVLFIYGPILIASLLDPSTAVKVEGLNYFFDTLLYAGTILALASAMPLPKPPVSALEPVRESHQAVSS
ncbi:MAG TPA: hypothetical protein VGS27_14870 [Candidatus Sulfotelmatobacter sp.]|nr:hypothetical protein [Candidatus Sulfotelmatobacter sp.]